MDNYFRITGYIPEKNLSFIMDSYGAYEKLWQFSSALIAKGCRILEVGSDEKFLDGNIPKLAKQSNKMVLRATAEEEPKHTTYEFNNMTYKSIQVGEKTYIPDKSRI
ncbi:MAG: hypothetical protein IJQ66_04255 [Clostridia bacterium]|nr:hypothetical protein [Clostridia bacterium]